MDDCNMNKYDEILEVLRREPKTWLITGVAGFIGSNLLEALLKNEQKVVGLENFSTGHQSNLDEVQNIVSTEQWERFVLIKGDIRSLDDCKMACEGVDFVLHQAALGSVPRSLNDPIATNENNIGGFINMLIAARDAKVRSFTYAASSSTYGDNPDLPKIEEKIGNLLSPYAVTKYVNELYSKVFALNYGFSSIGLRYFNVFGPRQDPHGPYAAVIPKWIGAILKKEDVVINGDGETSRDFCFIENAVQANILAACAKEENKNEVYNIAVGERTTLNQLLDILKNEIECNGINVDMKLSYNKFRDGDVRHSQAQIKKAQEKLGYYPSYRVSEGIKKLMPWYLKKIK